MRQTAACLGGLPTICVIRTDRSCLEKLFRGRELYVEGKLSEAEAVYCELLVEYQSQSAICRLLGVILGAQIDRVAAVECFLQALQFSPDYARASDHLGTALRQLNRVDEAIIAFERTCAIAHKIWSLRCI
ncbi:MAG: tetratricopeptide (TPR) repeat protein [Candidatus Azotimanducaceae bacterium]|jgi:tetratricopeptide (TPR) repeat protein